MATFDPIDVEAVFLGTTDTLIGEPAVGKSWAVARVCFCNTDTVDHQITIGTTTGASLDDMHTESKLYTVQAQSTFDWGPSFLPAGRKIFGKAETAAKVSARIHGIQRSA